MRWPWQTEKRASFEALVTDAIQAAATGADNGNADGLAALEQAVGLVGRCFASAAVSGDPMGLVDARVLELIGRELIRRGEVLFAIEGDPGRMRLAPCGTWDVRGADDPESWWYRLDIFGASEHRTRLVRGGGVVHLRVNVDPVRPWIGRAPHRIAATTSATAVAAEAGLQAELKLPRGRILPSPGTSEQLGQIAAEIRRGGLALVSSGADLNMGSRQDPAGAWKPAALGPEPTPSDLALRSETGRDTLAACGVPATLIDARADGTSRREAYRQLLHTTIGPMARLVELELSRKLDGPVRLSFDSLFAGDLAGRARAFQSLVKAGMDITKAASLAGLMEAEAA